MSELKLRDNLRCDVVVVGGGNAALCAALAARDCGKRVVVLERAARRDRGGNSAFTGGAMRVAYRGVSDLSRLVDGLGRGKQSQTDFGAYTEKEFFEDFLRVTDYRADAKLVKLVTSQSLATLEWLRSKGVRFVPSYGRQAFDVDGTFTFWGGLAVEVSGGGRGLVDALAATAAKAGAELVYRARAVALRYRRGRVVGVVVADRGGTWEVEAPAVVLACGGFESNPEWRAQYLGPNWDLAKVRGTRFNTGDGIRMALDVGAVPFGHWSGCHAVAWDLNAPDFGDIAIADGYQRHSYPFGIVVNAHGLRFLDEGLDFRNYTYAKYGKMILEQPGQTAWQIFDRKGAEYLRSEYQLKETTRIVAESLPELTSKLTGVDGQQLLRTIAEFNEAVDLRTAFNPNVKDGKHTVGLAIAKSNWALPISDPPFEAYPVTCGITFTFGGVRINRAGAVIDTEGVPIPGLFAAGELVGGLFFGNYPGGTGLTAGAVVGRTAGRSAAGQMGDVSSK